MEKRKDPIYQAQDILSRRDHSIHEVKTKLKRKGFTENQVTEAVTWLQEQKLLDDKKFARTFVENTLLYRAVGPRYLKLKLQQKGIAGPVLAAALQQAFPPGRESEVAKEAANAWRRAHPAHASDKNRLYRFLISRGFSPDKITLSSEVF